MMRQLGPSFGLFLVLAGVMSACGDSPADGVSDGTYWYAGHYGNPGYDLNTEELFFDVAVQYADFQGAPLDVEYEVLDGETSVTAGQVSARNEENTSGVITWYSDEVRLALPHATYSGREITIFVDPEGKVSSPNYPFGAESRKKTVTIP